MIRIRAFPFLNYPRSLHQSRMTLVLGLVVMLSTVCFPLSVHAQQGAAADRERLAQFQQSLDSLRRQYAIPGLSAVIVNHGQIIWEGGFGFQDVENHIPATPDTPYRTASITKTFASMLLMRCVQRGTLNLDTPIRNYTSGIADSRVTVRHLFTHTSQSSPPGETYLYSGDRYNFLTPVAESCGGQSFREALAKTILDRLEMRDSVPGQDMEFPSPAVAALFTPETLQRYTRVIQRLAKPYVVASSGRPILSAYPPRGIFAAAGLISTVRDLARYDAAIDQHILLPSQTQQQAWTNHVNSRGQQLPYAFGWFVQMYGNERLIWHYGQWDTFSGLFLKVPGRNITLILLANSSGLSAPFNALGAGNVTGSPFANLFLQMLSDPAAFRGNAIDLNSFFVRQQYLDFLGRGPDPPGFNGWVDTLNNCAENDASCDRVHVSEMFFRSAEFQERGYFVYRFYSSAFGRKPDFAEFTPDLARVSGFLTNDQLEAAKTAFVNDFMTRPAFAAQYNSLDNTAFVNTVLQTAGVALGNRQALIDSLNNQTATRAQILRQIAASGEVYQKYYNQAFVVMEYFGYLRRDPDALYLNWIQVLDANPADSRHMVEGFVNSDEYRNRFAQ